MDIHTNAKNPGQLYCSNINKGDISTEPLKINELNSLTEGNLTELIPSLTKENKMWILNVLGFSPRGKCQWYHPAMGLDAVFNRIDFDLDTDDIRMIIIKVYHDGFKYGRHNIQSELKSLLNIRG